MSFQEPLRLARSAATRVRARLPGAESARRIWRRARYERLLRKMAGPALLAAFADVYREPFFVEIGSNDGVKHDHLRPLVLSHPWRGIMVEPVPYVFERLARNYSDLERIELENVAIADSDGPRPFYHLAPVENRESERLPEWYDTLGSFSREVVLGHARHIPDLEPRIVCTEVPCLTFESLCRKHAVERVDLVVIDVEGYDAEIVRNLDLSAYRPRLLVYEHYHLSREDRAHTKERLESSGYETMEEGFDTWCLDPRADDRLTRLWRRIRPAVPGISALDESERPGG